MQLMDFWQRYKTSILQHAAIFGGVLILAYIFSSPVLEGKILHQGDIQQWRGMAKGAEDHREQFGEEPLWTSRMFSGMTAFNISVYYATDIFNTLQRAISRGLPVPVGHIMVLFLGMFVLLRAMGVNIWLSTIGALAFAFSSNYLISSEAGHHTKVFTMGYSAGLLGAVIMTYRGKELAGLLLAVLFTGFTLASNHQQIHYYLLIMILFTAVGMFVQAVMDKEIPSFFKRSGLLVAAAILGILPQFAGLWSIYEHGQETMRGGASELTQKTTKGGLEIDYAFRWSTRPDETATILVPYYMGGGSAEKLGNNSNLADVLSRYPIDEAQRQNILGNVPLYHGEMPFTSGPVYFGAGIILLFFLGLIYLKGVIRWVAVSLILLSFFMAWGEHFMGFNEFLFRNLPLYNKFRTPSMALHIAGVLFPVLALTGLCLWFQNKDKRKMQQHLLIGLAISGGFLAILALAGLATDFAKATDSLKLGGSFWMDQQEIYDAIVADRKRLYLLDVLRSTIFIGLIGGALWLHLKGKIKSVPVLYGVLGLLILADVWMVSKRYVGEEKFVPATEWNRPFQPRDVDLQIKQDPDPYYRVFDFSRNPFNDALTSYHHNSIGGYHAAKLQRYQDLIDFHIGQQRMSVLNMLNTKYFIVDNREGRVMAQRNPDNLGNAWFVGNYKVVANADEEIAHLDRVYRIYPEPGAAVYRGGNQLSAGDMVGSSDLLVLAGQNVPVDNGFTLDLRARRLPPGDTLSIGSGEAATFRLSESGVAPMHALLAIDYTFDPRNDALVDQRFSGYLEGLDNFVPQAGDQIQLTEFRMNLLRFESRAAGERLAVFSDIHYPKGWNVYIDGQQADYIRVNYALRGLRVPAGEHAIEWRFEPRTFITGSKVSLAGSLLMVLVVGGLLYMMYRRDAKAPKPI